MSGSVAELQAQLDGWYEALRKVQSGQRYTIGGVKEGRTLERADLPEIRKTIDWLEQKIAAANNGGIRIKRVVQ